MDDKSGQVLITFWTSKRQHRRLKARAKAQDRSMSSLLRRIIDLYLATRGGKTAMTKYQFLVAEIERLRENPTDTCVEWDASRSSQGYGRLGHNGRDIRVHRMAFELFYGFKPVNHVCHICDNPACYNPRHLYDATQEQNIADAYRRGRIVPKWKRDIENVGE